MRKNHCCSKHIWLITFFISFNRMIKDWLVDYLTYQKRHGTKSNTNKPNEWNHLCFVVRTADARKTNKRTYINKKCQLELSCTYFTIKKITLLLPLHFYYYCYYNSYCYNYFYYCSILLTTSQYELGAIWFKIEAKRWNIKRKCHMKQLFTKIISSNL